MSYSKYSGTCGRPTLRRRMRMALMASVTVLCVFAMSGCASRVILVHPSKDVMKLAEPVKARVFVFKNGQWVQSQNKITLPAGYEVLYVEPEK